MIDLQPVKGTRDFFPEEMRLRNWLFEIWRKPQSRGDLKNTIPVFLNMRISTSEKQVMKSASSFSVLRTRAGDV